jgi:hypothetical protein
MKAEIDAVVAELETQGIFINPVAMTEHKQQFMEVKQNLIDAGMYDDGHVITPEEVKKYGYLDDSPLTEKEKLNWGHPE